MWTLIASYIEGRDRMVVGFTTTCVIDAITTDVVSLNPIQGEVY
jgi:hypothetical protein